MPFTAGVFSINPALHLVINGDDFVEAHLAHQPTSDVKLWGGATISWSKDYGESAEEDAAETE